MKGAALDTPMMRQYLAIKAQHADSILLYRMGDFYEMFLEDALLAASLLDIALTTRDKGKPDAVPMCGVPVHSADAYIKRLASLGHRIAICEQVEESASKGRGGLVRREVVEVVTPGLVGDLEGLEARREVTLAAIEPAAAETGGAAEGQVGLAVLEASTGDFRATEIAFGAGESRGALPELLVEELCRVEPRELLVARDSLERTRAQLGACLPDLTFTAIDPQHFEPSKAPVCPEGFDTGARDCGTRAASALLFYLGVNQPFALSHPPRLRRYRLGDTMVLDAATRCHLELFENGEDRGRRGTLVERLDHSRTPLGARRLARWIAYPLLEVEEIEARQDAVAFLAEGDRRRRRLRDALGAVGDLERLLARAVRPASVPRDLGLLRVSLVALPAVRKALEGGNPDFLAAASPPAAILLPEPIPDLAASLCDGLVDEPPVIARGSRGALETGYIRPGFRPELDLLRDSVGKGREWIASLEQKERERTGIPGLKVRFHPVHGYSLEVSKSQLARVPENYERKQTLANVERYTTEELRSVESDVLGARERAAALEREIFESLRRQVGAAADALRVAAARVAELDALAALAEVARREGWVRPKVDAGSSLEIRAGRHPVVEAFQNAQGGDGFVPNDTDLDPAGTQILLLTGPNMSGKSTYLRQVALIVLLAQMGSFVPAESARIGAVDRIFTRVGASDRLARGESTFMVEMRETAEILRQASHRSLVILDEIGRGTSTYDGLAIAWAVVEHLHDTPGLAARTLFATHFHELSDLERTKLRVRNAHFEAREWKDEIVFLRRLASGSANRSYGIQVARLAGLPDPVISRARQILRNLERGEFDEGGQPRLAADTVVPVRTSGQIPLFVGEAPAPPQRVLDNLLAELESLDLDRTTPLEALAIILRWRESLGDGEEG